MLAYHHPYNSASPISWKMAQIMSSLTENCHMQHDHKCYSYPVVPSVFVNNTLQATSLLHCELCQRTAKDFGSSGALSAAVEMSQP